MHTDNIKKKIGINTAFVYIYKRFRLNLLNSSHISFAEAPTAIANNGQFKYDGI